MYLCDIGNSNVHLSHEGREWSMALGKFQSFSTDEKVFYINVNKAMKETLASRKNFVNLEPYLNLDTIYQGMGIDRVAACYTISDGIVIDAGSAITVDIMSSGLHLGGYILPGLSASMEAYKSISSVLDVRLNPNIAIDALPQKTQDAVSYGIIKPLIMLFNDTCRDKNTFFTGGDGKFFSRFFKHSIYDKSLIFRGMQKALNESGLLEGTQC
jgi:type III pantothenate kinase